MRPRDSHNVMKTGFLFCICLIGTIAFLPQAAPAATYYIDYASGSDTNSGTSTGSPWQHCPGDPRASDNANITLSAGDIVVFKGGVTYAFSTGTVDYIGANASGASENPITYRSGHLL